MTLCNRNDEITIRCGLLLSRYPASNAIGVVNKISGWSHDPRVGGSSTSSATISFQVKLSVF
jgi:hypothetical protein